MNLTHRIVLICTSVMLMLAVAGCGSSKKSTASGGYHTSSSKTPQEVSLAGLSDPERTLVKEAERWLGTPYKYGGNSRGGVDCSGFVYHVYQNSLSIKLPRNSAQQHDYCRKVKKSDLSAGDLVFFATNKGSSKVSHVGLYVGDGKMIHASTRKGVIVQNLSDDYYVRSYVGAGRVEQFTAMNSKASKKQKSKAKKVKKTRGDEAQPKSSGPTYVPSQLPPSASPTPSVPVSEPVVADPEPVMTAEPESVVTEPQPVVTAEPERAVAAPVVPEAPAAEPAPEPVKAVRIAGTPARQATDTPESQSDMRSRVLSSLPDLPQ